uniref:NACHT LRR and PYD domain-containing protein n=1 Tax=Acanthochromis polyacanthus TaxID=80966 RepID=A0A3Q1GQT1_9TELE
HKDLFLFFDHFGLACPLSYCILSSMFHDRLSNCGLSEMHCEVVSSALKSNPSHLEHLDLSFNILLDSGVKDLSAGLQSPNCKLETLRVFRYFPKIYILLDVDPVARDVDMNREGQSHSAEVTKEEHFELHIQNLNTSDGSSMQSFCYSHILFRLERCCLSEISCDSLSSALKSNPSHLELLDLSQNNLQDSGVKHLCGFLESPDCILKTLRSDIISSGNLQMNSVFVALFRSCSDVGLFRSFLNRLYLKIF